MGKIDLSKFNIRTDLIIENNTLEHEEIQKDNMTITKTIKDGYYITLSFQDITDFDYRELVGKNLELIIKDILKINKIKENDSCLIVGLGNSLSTPDSLGPKTLKDITVTNHLFTYGHVKDGIRRTFVFAPGVMANTGMETSTTIKAIIQEIKPGFVIVIDALASKSVDRINKTIQITDTGIHPGSGVGNNRVEISKKTIGIPVIAIGVPTVTTAKTIVMDTINYLYKHISYIKNNASINKLTYHKTNYKNKISKLDLTKAEKNDLLGLFGTLSDKEQSSLIEEVLVNLDLNLIVTPTEIDFLIDKLSNMIASSINRALHRQINH